MNGYRLNRLYINNFKLINEREIDFSSSDLLILDGPNGYGKTTVFDAIELLLSKQISRIDDNDVENNTHSHSDSLFAKDISKPILIKGKFNHPIKENLVLVIYLSANENSKKWTNYKCYQFNDYEDTIQNATLVENFDSILGLSENKIVLKNDLKNFYYIQQENNTQFFKKNENERISLLSKFFGTDDAVKLKNDLNEKLKKIKDVKKSLSDKLKEKKDELKELNKQVISISSKDVKYISLNVESTWNKEEFIPASNERLKEIINEIENIQYLLKHVESFKIYRENKKYKEILESTSDIKRFIVFERFKDNYQNIKSLSKKELQYVNIKKIIFEKDYDKLKQLKLKGLYTELKIDNYDEKVDKIEAIKSNIDKLIQESGEMSNLARVINDTRESLVNKYIEFEDESKDKGICPLCGYDSWKTFENLEKEFKKKKAFFEEFKDEKATKATELKEQLFTVELKELFEYIEKYLETSENIISIDFFKQLEKYADLEKHIPFVKKLKELSLYDELLKYANPEKNEVKDISGKIEEINDLLKKKEKIINNDEFFEKEQNISSAFKLYKVSFENLNDINNEKTKQKKEWLEFKYFSHEEAKKEVVQKSIDEINIKIKLLKKLIETSTIGVVKTLHDKLDNKIKDQWKSVIKKIEIPLYIYSGKILQDTQRGNGVFIDYDTTKKKSPLKFLSTLESDYDATFSMSSGQLSALVISLTLALNKVYGMNDNGGMLLIDDPMQSMDEINIASFIELIRNDFDKSQFILSTHESKISRLLQYKYLKYKKNVKCYSVKDEFFNEPI